jgi:hypothetical protein
MSDDCAMTTLEELAGDGSEAAPARRRVRLPRLRRRDGRAPLTLELALVAWLFYLYDVINNLAPTRLAQARSNASGVLSLERSLHIDIERTLNRWLSAHSVVAFVATYYYFFAHVLVTFAVLAWLWWSNPAMYSRARTQLVLINLIAFAVFWRYPLAPPRMFPALGYQDVVAQSHAVFSWHSGALRQDADQYAAMPSLHIAWASWSALWLWQVTRRRVLRALAIVHPLLTAVVVLATGNHWVLDVLAGATTFVLGVAAQRLLWRLGAARRRAGPVAERSASGIGVGGAATVSERMAQTSSGPT